MLTASPNRPPCDSGAENDPVGSYVDQIIDGMALTIEEEEQLIWNERWKRAP